MSSVVLIAVLCVVNPSVEVIVKDYLIDQLCAGISCQLCKLFVYDYVISRTSNSWSHTLLFCMLLLQLYDIKVNADDKHRVIVSVIFRYDIQHSVLTSLFYCLANLL